MWSLLIVSASTHDSSGHCFDSNPLPPKQSKSKLGSMVCRSFARNVSNYVTYTFHKSSINIALVALNVRIQRTMKRKPCSVVSWMTRNIIRSSRAIQRRFMMWSGLLLRPEKSMRIDRHRQRFGSGCRAVQHEWCIMGSLWILYLNTIRNMFPWHGER